MNDTYLPLCCDGQGHVHSVPAEGELITPEGAPTGPMCHEHAEACITEYREKLAEQWAFRPFTQKSSSPPWSEAVPAASTTATAPARAAGLSEDAMPKKAYAFRSGEIGFADRVPLGALPILGSKPISRVASKRAPAAPTTGRSASASSGTRWQMRWRRCSPHRVTS